MFEVDRTPEKVEEEVGSTVKMPEGHQKNPKPQKGERVGKGGGTGSAKRAPALKILRVTKETPNTRQ